MNNNNPSGQTDLQKPDPSVIETTHTDEEQKDETIAETVSWEKDNTVAASLVLLPDDF